jgi:hypothetical protein
LDSLNDLPAILVDKDKFITPFKSIVEIEGTTLSTTKLEQFLKFQNLDLTFLQY